MSNYTPLNTGYFNGVLSGADNNLQAAMDTLDDHTHYTLSAGASSFNPVAGTNYRFGAMHGEPPQTTANRCIYNIPKAGTIKAASARWIEWGGVAGSAESIGIWIRVNNTTSYLIASVATTAAAKTFINNELTIPVIAGDFLELLIITPAAWATPPTLVRLSAVIYIET